MITRVCLSRAAHVSWSGLAAQSRWLTNCSVRLAMIRHRSLLGLAVVAFVMGCGGSSSTPIGPSSGGSLAPTLDGLAGTWNLLSIQLAGQADQATPPGASYTVTFTGGRLSARLDCNVCNGGFALSGQTLTAGPALACTRAACPTLAFESA